MLEFFIITIFPEVLGPYFNSSILKRAQKNKLIKVKLINPRHFVKDKHKAVDDKPYGGGPGMIFKAEPLLKAVLTVLNDINVLNEKKKSTIKTTKTNRTGRTKVVILSPRGKQFTQTTARQWAKNYKHIILISGHYEGIDERVKKVIHDSGFMIQEISIGPYILTGGELPAMIVVDAVSRHIKGVLGKEESLEELRNLRMSDFRYGSASSVGLGYPVYTRPEVLEWPPKQGKKGKKYRVPKVLLSGDHRRIEQWRRRLSKD